MDRLQDIFEHKKKSSFEFRAVQKKHGLIGPLDLLGGDPETREGALELHKGLHWINLELSEFIGASEDEQAEELADVLHFLVEFAILAGFDYTIVPEGLEGTDRLDVLLASSVNDAFVFDRADANARFTILAALKIAEIIKNKPWKQTLRPIDRDELKRRTMGMFYWFGATVRTAGFTSQVLYNHFVRKEEINHQRVATGV